MAASDDAGDDDDNDDNNDDNDNNNNNYIRPKYFGYTRHRCEVGVPFPHLPFPWGPGLCLIHCYLGPHM